MHQRNLLRSLKNRTVLANFNLIKSNEVLCVVGSVAKYLKENIIDVNLLVYPMSVFLCVQLLNTELLVN